MIRPLGALHPADMRSIPAHISSLHAPATSSLLIELGAGTDSGRASEPSQAHGIAASPFAAVLQETIPVTAFAFATGSAALISPR